MVFGPQWYSTFLSFSTIEHFNVLRKVNHFIVKSKEELNFLINSFADRVVLYIAYQIVAWQIVE